MKISIYTCFIVFVTKISFKMVLSASARTHMIMKLFEKLTEVGFENNFRRVRASTLRVKSIFLVIQVMEISYENVDF